MRALMLEVGRSPIGGFSFVQFSPTRKRPSRVFYASRIGLTGFAVLRAVGPEKNPA